MSNPDPYPITPDSLRAAEAGASTAREWSDLAAAWWECGDSARSNLCAVRAMAAVKDAVDWRALAGHWSQFESDDARPLARACLSCAEAGAQKGSEWLLLVYPWLMLDDADAAERCMQRAEAEGLELHDLHWAADLCVSLGNHRIIRADLQEAEKNAVSAADWLVVVRAWREWDDVVRAKACDVQRRRMRRREWMRRRGV